MDTLDINRKEYNAVVRLCQAVLMQRFQDLTSKSKKKIAQTYRHQAYKFLRDEENCRWFCEVADFPYSKVQSFLANYSLSNYS